MASIIYQVPVEPTVVGWLPYQWNALKELLWYLTTTNSSANGFPLSKTSQAYLWAGVLAICVGGWWFLRKYKLI